MRRVTLFTATSLAALCMLATSALAVPVTTSFTARITDGSGPINGNVNLNFKIFTAASGGTMQWEETHTGVTADNGLVFVNLGSIAPTTNGLDATVFTGGDMWLEISIDNNAQSPRLPIGSVPYAVHASTADTLGSLAPADVALSTHNHDADYSASTHDHNAAYSALSHNHNAAYSAISHNHNTAYAAISHTHALPAHNHSAANITSGTLSTARYDAYADLGAAGRLDNNASADLVTRIQGDGRWSSSTHGHSIVGVVVQSADISPGGFRTATAFCPSSNPRVIGGGVDGENVLTLSVTSSGPLFGSGRTHLTPDGTYTNGNGWYAGVRNDAVVPYFFKVAALCSD